MQDNKSETAFLLEQLGLCRPGYDTLFDQDYGARQPPRVVHVPLDLAERLKSYLHARLAAE